MNQEEQLFKIKKDIKDILGSNIKFNNDFEKCVFQLGSQIKNLVDWCVSVKNGEIKYQIPRKDNETITFIKKIGNSNRCVVLKQKNGEFIEIHLGDHKYYDFLRKKLKL